MTVSANEPLSIRKFFAGKRVLLTGATGFLAKAVMEKLLHDLPEVERIYLLIRPKFKKDGTRVDSRQRLEEEVYRNSAFLRLRDKMGERFEDFCAEKVDCVTGDLTRERLGLDEAEFRELAGKIDVIINSAATVVFDERLDLALNLNTLGPQRLLELARAGHAIYVHISTAYVCGRRTGNIPEKLLSPLEAIDAQLPPGVPRPERFVVQEEIASLWQAVERVKGEWSAECERRKLDSKSEEAREELERRLVAAGMKRAHQLGWNDTYTFTKFLGEQLIYQQHGKVPTVIIRPSIIESSLREPEPGWLDGLRMADPIIIGFGKGRLPDFPANLNIALDIIPADFVVNCILAGAAHIARIPGGFDLFTIASSTKNPLWFESLYTHVRDYFVKHPFTDKNGRPIRIGEWKFRSMHEYRSWMVNRYLRPAQLALKLVNGPVPIPYARRLRPRLKNSVARIEQLLYYVDIYGPYVNLDCRFEIDHSFELLESLTPAEREQFNFDPRRFHWRHYLQDIHIPGLKRNILRMDALPRTGASQGRLLEEEETGRKRATVTSIRGVPQTIVDFALRGKERFGNKTIWEIRRSDPANGPAHVRLSYEEAFERSGRLGRMLGARLGLHPGDRVVLIGENCPEWALAYFAISRSGATAVPLDRMLPPAEFARITKFVEAKAVIASPMVWQAAREHLGTGHGLPPTLNLFDNLNPFPGEHWPQKEADPEKYALKEPAPVSLASILFTSGTTLEPKGVMLTHANFVANAMAVSEVLEPLESDRFLSVLPLHHAFEFTCGLLIPMYGGATVYYLEKLRGQEVLDAMRLNEITVLLGVPRLFQLFKAGIEARIAETGLKGELALELGEMGCLLGEVLGLRDLRPRVFRKIHDAFGGHLRVFVSGGAALDPEIYYFFKRFGITVCEGYGLTETAPVLAVNPLSATKPGSVGPVVPGMEINIQSLEGDDEEHGEILVRGPAVMHGYWKNPEATAAVFDNGWFKTGDVGRLDEDGYLYITGRVKDIIVTSAGKNVHPDEVEYHLRDLPGVKELCVIGLPGRHGQGEEVVAVVVPENGADRVQINAAIHLVNKTMPSYQRVSRVEFQSEDLPKTSTLKVQRAKVRARYLETSGAEALKMPSPAVETLAATAKEAVAHPDGLAIEVARAIARVAGHISPADVHPGQSLQLDLGIDSIGRVELLHLLENKFNVTFPPQAENQLTTVREVMDMVEVALKSGGKTRFRRWRPLWERARVQPGALEIGMQQSRGRIALRRIFEAVTGLIMSTHLRVRGDGLEHLPANGPYILVANHSSHLDLPAVRKVLGRRADILHAMAAKDYFFNTRFKSWFFTTFLNALPLDREANPAESLAACKTVLDSGRPILLFPEGTRSQTGELQPFRPGIGVLAVELDVPIIPVWIQGTFAALPKGRIIPMPGPIEVRIGQPVELSALKAEKGTASPADLYRRAAALLREKVEELADLPPIK